ncbi:hypothetical protein Adt_35138 [Abeliophyllum distichum]|uniref:Uncharacterized protein n=1 Tax=Abeliophyllum distichum TaxID=126358 RepID=A0ABD1QDV8_9LAMI
MEEGHRGGLSDLLRLVEMNLIRGLVLTMEVYNTLEGFDGKFTKEKANSKKLSKDLKAMRLEKVQLESEKRFHQARLDILVVKEDDLKAKYEVKLMASKECLKDARDRKRAAEAAQKSVEEAQKLAEDRAFAAETAIATANSALEAMVAEKDRLLAEVRREIEQVKADRANAEAKAMVAYQEGFEDTPEYQDLAHHFMTADREQLVERIADVHPEWDLSLLRHPPSKAPTLTEPQEANEARGPIPTSQVGPRCDDPSEVAGHY